MGLQCSETLLKALLQLTTCATGTAWQALNRLRLNTPLHNLLADYASPAA